MNIAVNVASEKFKQFEWLTHGISAKSPNFEPQAHGTGEKPLNYQDRLGAIASMETQLAKSVTALIVFDGKSQSDYEFVRNHLAKILIQNAVVDKKREPENISMHHLAYLIARMVIDFSLNPELEENYTAKGRLYYAGIGSHQMTLKAYDCTWKQYEKLMALAIESAIDEASKSIEKYKKNTYKEMKN
jgi:D-arabinose 1-dehydrogenase-like Zn-dependent alcohol dehydrogenase